MISVNTALRRLGGTQRLIKMLGYPVNIYTIQIWKRDGYFPEEYRDQIAEALDVDPTELDPKDGAAPAMKYRLMARVYKAMLHACDLKPRRAAAEVHGVGIKVVEDWSRGYVEVPLHAFEEIHAWVAGTARKDRKLTIDRVLLATGLSQSELCRRLGVTPAMGTYWRKRRQIPEPYVEHALALVSEIREQAKQDQAKVDEVLEDRDGR